MIHGTLVKGIGLITDVLVTKSQLLLEVAVDVADLMGQAR